MNRELCLSTIADNGSFALEYYLWKEPIDNKLLENGIKYCDYMIDSTHGSVMDIFRNEDEFEILETIQEYYSREKLLKYTNKAMEIRDVLLDILQKNKVEMSEEKIRSYQHFFNETSRIFLHGASRKLKIYK